jgi:hypothetical protein
MPEDSALRLQGRSPAEELLITAGRHGGRTSFLVVDSKESVQAVKGLATKITGIYKAPKGIVVPGVTYHLPWGNSVHVIHRDDYAAMMQAADDPEGELPS